MVVKVQDMDFVLSLYRAHKSSNDDMFFCQHITSASNGIFICLGLFFGAPGTAALFFDLLNCVQLEFLVQRRI